MGACVPSSRASLSGCSIPDFAHRSPDSSVWAGVDVGCQCGGQVRGNTTSPTPFCGSDFISLFKRAALGELCSQSLLQGKA